MALSWPMPRAALRCVPAALAFVAPLVPVGAAAQSYTLAPALTAQATVERGDDVKARFSITNLDRTAPERVRFAVQVTGNGATGFGGVEHISTRFANQAVCEVPSRDPVIVQCSFDGEYLLGGRQIWADVYAAPRSAPETVTFTILQYQYKVDEDDASWTDALDTLPERSVTVDYVLPPGAR